MVAVVEVVHVLFVRKNIIAVVDMLAVVAHILVLVADNLAVVVGILV